MPPILSIVIVTWNVRDLLMENLRSIFSLSTSVTFEVIVVDNGSKDATARAIREHFPQVHLIALDWNSGFGSACNRGLRAARGRHVLFLNSDMRMGAGVLERVVEVLENDADAGAMTVKLVREDGEPVRAIRRDPTLWSQLALLVKLPHLFPHLLDREQRVDFDYGRAQDVEQIRGAFMAMRKDVLDVVGAFDERFFVWFEDVDLCRRIRAAGWKIRYIPDVSAVDLVGRGIIKIPIWKRQWMFFSSMAKYFWKWKGVSV